MKLITEITNEAKQTLTFPLDDGSTVAFSLSFVDNQNGWFYSFTHSATGFAANNRRLVTSPNMLRAFREILPFGFMCNTSDSLEPIYQSDFSSGRAKFYLLSAADVALVETGIKNSA